MRLTDKDLKGFSKATLTQIITENELPVEAAHRAEKLERGNRLGRLLKDALSVARRAKALLADTTPDERGSVRDLYEQVNVVRAEALEALNRAEDEPTLISIDGRLAPIGKLSDTQLYALRDEVTNVLRKRVTESFDKMAEAPSGTQSNSAH